LFFPNVKYFYFFSMGIITFLSDFGYMDHYVAVVKAAILSKDPSSLLVDISHGVEPFNLPHGVQVLRASFPHFPDNSVHLVAVDTHGSRDNRFLAIRFRQHFFVAPDNGILSLLTDSAPDEMVELSFNSLSASPTSEILAPAALRLAQGELLGNVGKPTNQMHELLNRQLRLGDHSITGHVIHVDHYGNLITDISRESIEAIAHGRSCTIHFARETVSRIHTRFNQVDEGDCVCIFNRQGQLCIGINKGHASELLGLFFDSQVDVRFYD
jgi:S-adenosyl-L-methionine hydrolase (adenosine-forming)